jgi:hypothetical protein
MAPMGLQFAGDRDSVGVIPQPQDRKQGHQLEAVQVVAAAHFKESRIKYV